MPSLSNDNDINITVGTTADNSGLQTVSSSLGNMVDNFQSGMRKISVVTGAAGVALTAFSKSSVDTLSDLVKTSKTLAQQTGMTTEQSSQLIAAMKKVGLSADTASASFRIFAKQIQDVRDGNSGNALAVEQMNNKIAAAKIQIQQYTEAINKNGDSSGILHNKIDALNLDIKSYTQNIQNSSNALDSLGVSTQNADGSNKGFNDILLEVADKFKAMPDGVQKTSDALQLFGRSGASMIKILDQGSDGIKNLESEADKLGLTLTTKNISAVDQYVQSQKKLSESTQSVKIAVGTLTAPLMADFNNAINKVMGSLVGVDSPLRGVTTGVLAFGGPVLGATSALTGFVGNLDNALPILTKLGGFLLNPMFLAFAAAVAVVAFAVYKLQESLGGWSNLMQLVDRDLQALWGTLSVLLGPSVEALWNSISQNLMPALQQLMDAAGPILIPILKVLGAVIGIELIGFIYVLVNGLRLLIDILAWCAGLWTDIATAAVTGANRIQQNWNILLGYFRTVKEGFYELLVEPFERFYNNVTSIPGKIEKAFSNLGKNISGSLSNMTSVHIPGFATGVTNFGGGLAVVGENGPELVDIPKGSDVLTNRQSASLVNNNSSSSSVTIGTVVLASADAVTQFFSNLDQDNMLTSKGLSPRRGMA